MSENNVIVSGNVNTDNSDDLANLYLLARRFRDANNGEYARKYYEMILLKDPNSWEASFYVVYFKATECKIAEIQSAAISVTNCIDDVLNLINDNISDLTEQVKAYTEVATKVMTISTLLINAAYNHYDGIDYQIRNNYRSERDNRVLAGINCVILLGDKLDSLFGNSKAANKLSVTAWEMGVKEYLSLKEPYLYTVKKEIGSYEAKIKKYNPNYVSLIDKKIKEKNEREETIQREHEESTRKRKELNSDCRIGLYVIGAIVFLIWLFWFM